MVALPSNDENGGNKYVHKRINRENIDRQEGQKAYKSNGSE